MAERGVVSAAIFALALVACDGATSTTGGVPSAAPGPGTSIATTSRPAPQTSTSAGSARVDARAPGDSMFYLESLSNDGERALLVEVGGAPSNVHYRVVEVDSGRLVIDLPLRSVSALPLETIDDGGKVRRTIDDLLKDKGVAQDLVKAAEVLRDFPLGAGGRVAASTAGIIAFNAGDWIYAAEADGAPKRRVAEEASYAPWFSPDAKSLLYRRLNGSLDGVEGKYEIFAGPADLTKPARELRDTAAALYGFALSKDGKAVRLVASFEPVVKTCVVRVELESPYETKKEVCLKDGEKLSDGRLSPTGAYAVLFTEKDLAEDDASAKLVMPDGTRKAMKKRARRMRVVDVEEAAVVADVPRPMGTFVAVSDTGQTVFFSKERLVLRDARAADVKELANDPLDPNVGFIVSARFRSPSELVYVKGETVGLLDVKRATWQPVK